MDADKVLNFRQRAINIQPNSPYSTLKSLLECLIGIVRGESLETFSAETQDERDARRVKINSTVEELMNLLTDPSQLYADYLEQKRQEQE